MSQLSPEGQQNEQTTVDELVGWVKQHDFSLNLNSEHLSFLVAIALLSKERFDEELAEGELHDAFAIVQREFNGVESGANNAFKANNAINSLVAQRLLSRFTSEGQEGNSIYRLSPLAVGITEYYLRHRQFSKLKLSIQLTLAGKELASVVEIAERMPSIEGWRKEIYGSLKYSVAEIFDQIDLNQRVMDEEQHQVKAEIAELLNQDWREAIHHCETLLSATSNTLTELQSSLQAAGDELQSQLLTLQQLVYGKEDLDYIDAVLFSLQIKLDRIISWGQQSIDLWIGYDRHVHKFIRTAIDMDKNRAFSQRLRQSIKDFGSNSWLLTFADAERLRDLRDESMVLSNDEALGILPPEVEYQEMQQVTNELAEQVKAMLLSHKQHGAKIDLGEVLTNYLATHSKASHFDLARLVVDQAVKLGYSEQDYAAIQPDWQSINDYGAKVQANVINKF
ncbi:chromosome partition protein MukF [Vibrio sp. UCD-FRSSP16_10]|uniref:chromosome partition protein MukF n=1 Tax=unclassified Vibrio TaxID=2614977 RepID=UPI0007FEB971|nr:MULTISPECIES: chromosome partition protein MukF [unclassified Vibrio]OBT15945.1 chromosome partition protein MukF [Vibrio sp. UCD-FRSSP16_10]OBT17839.1 chromosome partition protein MukF [Vibrio sp. UCD-FRSSP16_30]